MSNVIAICKIKSVSPVSFSKYVQEPKLNKELPKDYEERTWQEKAHYDEKNDVFIPGTMFKNCISAAAKYLSMKVPGGGKATYTKNFEAGIMCFAPVYIGVKKENLTKEKLFVPSDGRRGGTTRVEKCFPIIKEWEGEVEFVIVDSLITKDVFQKHLEEAGNLIGIGRFRPRNNGYYGRFTVESIDWRVVND